MEAQDIVMDMQKRIVLLELEKTHCELNLDKCMENMSNIIKKLEDLESKVDSALKDK